MAHQLLQSWGPRGWVAHLHTLRELYMRKACALSAAVEQQLSGLVAWTGTPTAGMFMWLQLLGESHHAGCYVSSWRAHRALAIGVSHGGVASVCTMQLTGKVIPDLCDR
jgi:DNA-binding transcriptional MocR family regulator